MFKKLGLAIAAWLSLAAIPAQGQTPNLLDRMMKEDSASVNAVVLYPKDVREAIFVAATRTDALIHISNLQTRSKQEFQAILKGEDREYSKKLWELSRYPDLVAFLAKEKRSKSDVKKELTRYPEVIHAMVLELNKKKRGKIVAMAKLNADSAASFAQLLGRYDAPVKTALKKLLELPEVLAILTEHVDLTAEVGLAYMRDTVAFTATVDALSLKVVRERAEAEAAWLESMKNDPKAMAELEKSAKDYEHEMALNDAPYVYKAEPNVQVSVTYHVYPYSYWYGYPGWYASPYWYPYPRQYHAGFYIGPNGAVIFVGTPSYHFTYWHFHVHGRHYAYPHLSHHFARHHHKYRHGGGVSDAVQDWADNNRDRLPRDWSRRQTQTGPDFFRGLDDRQGPKRPEAITERDVKRDRQFERRQRTTTEKRLVAGDGHARAMKREHARREQGSRSGNRGGRRN